MTAIFLDYNLKIVLITISYQSHFNLEFVFLLASWIRHPPNDLQQLQYGQLHRIPLQMPEMLQHEPLSELLLDRQVNEFAQRRKAFLQRVPHIQVAQQAVGQFAEALVQVEIVAEKQDRNKRRLS